MRICPSCGYETRTADTCPQCAIVEGASVLMVPKPVVVEVSSPWDRMTRGQRAIDHMMRSNGATMAGD